MNRVQEAGKREEGIGLVLLKKPVQRVETIRRMDAGQEVREGSTGRVVYVAPGAAKAAVAARAKLLMLPRVWAVAETVDVAERLQPLPPFPADAEAAPDAVPVTGEALPIGEVVPMGEAAPVADDLPVWEADEDDDGEEVEALPVELAFYRKYTEAMLRRYVRLSMAVGRVPSLLGRELFRGHVSSYRMTNFEDVVVFCFDMEKLLGGMRELDKQLIKKIGMQEYPQGEVASMMRISLRNCTRIYAQAVDRLTELLLEAGMLELLKR